jgi:hypothetical protein
MKILLRPIRTTIVFGLICGLSFIPLSLLLNSVIAWTSAICLALWLYVAGYGILLNRWSKKNLVSIIFPLLILLLAIFLMDSVAAFFLLALIVISWMRSGICFQKSAWIRLAVELLLCITGGVLISAFTPGSLSAWALGVWMFFLVQSLYFVIFDTAALNTPEKHETDFFERARKHAEDILSAGWQS